MNIRKTIARWILKAAGASTSGLTPMSQVLIDFIAGRSASGKLVNEDSAMTLSTMFGCCRIISESIGTIPWSIYRREGDGGATKDDSHPLAGVLNGSPNVDMTSVEFREALALNLCQSGNAYSLKETLGGEVVSLYPVPSARMKVAQKNGSNTPLKIADGDVFYSYLDRGKWSDLPREKIWHVKGFGNNGIIGLSPIGSAREALGMSLAAEEFGSRFFSQGGKPSGTVTVPNWLTKEQREIARENLTQMLGGLANAHKFALFEGGMKPEPWGGMPLNDMEYVLLRRFSVQEICRFYRIPPHMVADLEKGASYASIEMMFSEFVMLALMPYFTRIESSCAKWLIKPSDRANYFLRFNYEGLLRADSAARSEFYAKALQNGWMSRNEVRSLENRNRVDGLDEYTAQINLAPVGRLDALAVAAATSKRPTDAPPSKGVSLAVLNVSPERSLSIAHHAGNIDVRPAQVRGGDIRVEPAQVTVTSGDTHVAGGEVHLEANLPAAPTDNEAVVKALAMLGELVDGARKSQEESRALARKLLGEV